MRIDIQFKSTPLEQLTAPPAQRAIGVTFTGTFNGLQSYKAHRHCCKHSGVSWVCVEDCIGQKPMTHSKYWVQISEKGKNGGDEQITFQRSKDVARREGGKLARKLFERAQRTVEPEALATAIIERFDERVSQYAEDTANAL